MAVFAAAPEIVHLPADWRPGRINFETRKRSAHYIAGSQDAAKAGSAVHISSVAQPLNHLDALPLLLDDILGDGDVTLIDEGDGGAVLLDLAAGCLAGLRCRVLRAAEVLPGIPGIPMPSHLAGPSKASVSDDESLIQSFQALTKLDQTCDRIVLLVNDAHALQDFTLRYIQFVTRSSVHLQFIFCGTHEFLDLLNREEFTGLRARLTAGWVVTLAVPTAKASSMLPNLPSVADDSAAWVGETAVPSPGTRRPAVPAGISCRILWLGALALLGLGGAAWLTFGLQGGEANGPATSRQAAAAIQPPVTPKPPAVSVPQTQIHGDPASHAASEASPAAPDALVPHSPATASDVQDAGSASPTTTPLTPPSTAAPSAPVTALPQTKADAPEPEPNRLQLPEPVPGPGPARSLGRQDVPTAPSRTAGPAFTQPQATPEPPAVSAPGTQVRGGAASHADSGSSPAASNASTPHLPNVASDAQGVGAASASSMPLTPPSTAASGATVWPRAKAGALKPEPNELRLPEPARSFSRQSVPTAPSHTVAAAPAGRLRQRKEIGNQSAPLPADDHWLAPQPVSGSGEPPGGQAPRYIGSYAIDANGVRVFHSEP